MTGSSSQVNYIPRRDWDLISRRVANISQLELLIPDLEFTSLEKGLNKTIEWFKREVLV